MTYLSDDKAPEHEEAHELLHLIERHLDLHKNIRYISFDSDNTHEVNIVMESGSVWKLQLIYINSQDRK